MIILPSVGDPAFFSLVLLPILIFLARVADVTFGTMRIIFVSRGMKVFAAVLGFFEVLIWIIAIGQIMQNLSNPVNYLAYAAGFAAGNYVGIFIEQKVAMGVVLIRVITQHSAEDLIVRLKDIGFRTTSVDAQGQMGAVSIVFVVVKRRQVPVAVSLIRAFNPNAFYTIEDVRQASGGIFSQSEPFPLRGGNRFVRKGK